MLEFEIELSWHQYGLALFACFLCLVYDYIKRAQAHNLGIEPISIASLVVKCLVAHSDRDQWRRGLETSNNSNVTDSPRSQ